ncbi:5155_t:CDS:2 [Gigaspora margarita]|uniref:5155_t:CDS:1 n=1 Tax=Gigaspora margarita TaxID=4874 RepID=A0ABN7V6T5_GIGMA|nr:5155_t:CDS:2 [Gigaspora margarita]
MYICYNNWSIAHVQSIYITVSAQLLPEVDKCTKLVSKESINISLPQKQNVVNFYENLDDFSATNINEFFQVYLLYQFKKFGRLLTTEHPIKTILLYLTIAIIFVYA